MVNVIREVYGKTRCTSCGTLLDYERSDVLHDREVDFDTGYITERSSIQGPVCLKLTKTSPDLIYKNRRGEGVRLRREDVRDITDFDVMEFKASLYCKGGN